MLIHWFFLWGGPSKGVCTTCLWGQGGSVHCRGCGSWPATFWTVSSSSEVLEEKSGLNGVCELLDPNDGGVAPLLHPPYITCITFYLNTVQIHNDITYLIQRQQTSLFRKWHTITFHYATNRNTPHLSQRKLSTVFLQISATLFAEIFLSPSLKVSTCLLHKPKWVYDPNFPIPLQNVRIT